MKSLAIIPARSGSKGLPDKNIIDLAGKPLMYYTIKAALDSACFDEVMVSTDSEKYATVAVSCGASVPFLRSQEMSGDSAGSWDTVREVLHNYQRLGKTFDYVALMQPTSPLRDKSDICGIFQMLDRQEVHNAVTVTAVDHPVQWCFRMPENGSMEEMAHSPYNNMRRQDLETHYIENGAIYLVDAKMIMNKEYNFYEDRCFGYVMSREKSVDIDSRIDLMVAGEYMKILESMKK